MEQVEENSYSVEGSVYALVNQYYRSSEYWVVKIGKSKNVEKRRCKLSSQTAAPDDFITAISMKCMNPHDTEQLIHKILEDKRINKEFFLVQLQDVQKWFSMMPNRTGDVMIHPIDKAFWSPPGNTPVSRARTPRRSRSQPRIQRMNQQPPKDSGNE